MKSKTCVCPEFILNYILERNMTTFDFRPWCGKKLFKLEETKIYKEKNISENKKSVS